MKFLPAIFATIIYESLLLSISPIIMVIYVSKYVSSTNVLPVLIIKWSTFMDKIYGYNYAPTTWLAAKIKVFYPI